MMKTIQNFFISLSGIFRPALQIEENHHLVSWYMGMSIAMCFSVIWAMFGSSYTIFSITENITFAIGAGIFVGLFIFNLERTIILTPKTGIWQQDAKVLLPRLILTGVLNLGFAYSVEILLFQNRVDKEVQEIVKKDNASCEQDVTNQLNILNKKLTDLDNNLANNRNAIFRNDAQYSKFESKINELNAQITNNLGVVSSNAGIIGANTTQEKYYDKISEQNRTRNVLNGTAVAKSAENRAFNTQIKINRNEIQTLKKSIVEREKALIPQIQILEASITTQRTDLLAQIQSITANRKQAIDNCQKEKLSTVDFWTKAEALDRIKEQGEMKWKIWFVLLILWTLDSIVVLLKAWSRKNGYDEYMLRLDYISRVNCQEEISKINDTINQSLEEMHQILTDNRNLSVQVNQERLQAMYSTNQRLTELAAEKGFLLAEAMVEKWFQEELTKIHHSTTPSTTPANGLALNGFINRTSTHPN